METEDDIHRDRINKAELEWIANRESEDKRSRIVSNIKGTVAVVLLSLLCIFGVAAEMSAPTKYDKDRACRSHGLFYYSEWDDACKPGFKAGY